MFHLNSYKNKFGYFTVGDNHTYSRFEASQISQRTGQTVKWYLNDIYYNSFDWTKEPIDDIQTLYKKRAESLRDSYDYLVLMYSGGIDSCNMLHAFIDNNIKLDEICTVGSIKGSNNNRAFAVGEVLHEAVPYIKKLQNSNLLNGTKFRLIDSSDQVYNTLKHLNIDSREETFVDFNLMNNLTSISKWDVRSYVKDYAAIVDSNIKLCLIWGEGKPSIQFDQQKEKHKFVLYLNGTYDFACSPKLQKQNNPGYFDEMFYWDDANIMIKQSHMCLHYLKNVELFKDIFVDLEQIKNFNTLVKQSEKCSYNVSSPLLSYVITKYNNKSVVLKLPFLHNLIYPKIQPPLFNQGKQKSKIYNPIDEWLRDSLPEQSGKWYDGYNHHSVLGNLQGKITPGLTNFSKEFYLE
jgi:hypothetical protein